MPTRNYSASLWPDLLMPQSVTVQMDRPLFKGPKPLAGREQVVAVDSGGWNVSYENITLAGSTRFLTYRSLWIEIAANGLPVYVKPDFGAHTYAKRNNLTVGTTPAITMSAAANRNATTISATNNATYPLQAGDYFELNGRLHIIKSYVGSTITFWPPLRGFYSGGVFQTSTPTGTALETYDPRCLMYATVDSRANAMTLSQSGVSQVSIDFIEASW